MSEACLVTVGLPVYNSERYLRQSLDSLLAQTFANFVLVISDNASTDGTAQICRQYAAADARIKYSRNETNIGSPRNFNRVAELANTRYLKWSTADDFRQPTFLERALEVMERDPTIALCYPQAVLIDKDGHNQEHYDDVLHLLQEDPADRFLTLLDKIKLSHQHLGLIRMSHLHQTHLLGAYVASDITLLAELSLYGKFFELPHRLYFRRFHPDSSSWKRSDDAHQARRYHGTGAQPIGFNKWHRYLGLLAGVRRSPLALQAKTRLYRYLSRHMIWDRRDLAAELVEFGRTASGGIFSRRRTN
ncbi:MAG: glycosyltransferase family 2 protein [Burkholderiaceae bacterium]|nr:glycosyltransferase family 2 protein [Burkholderiaceae bacterium]